MTGRDGYTFGGTRDTGGGNEGVECEGEIKVGRLQTGFIDGSKPNGVATVGRSIESERWRERKSVTGVETNRLAGAVVDLDGGACNA